MKKIICLVLTALTMSSSVAVFAKQDEMKTKDKNINKSINEKKNTQKEEFTYRVARYYNERSGLNPHAFINDRNNEVMSRIYGKLLTYVLNDKGDGIQCIPYHAKDFPSNNEDFTVWTFELRDDLKFSDGTPITAHTYEYSYKMLLDPILKNYKFSILADDLNIKNAASYFSGACEWDDVGIKVIEGNKLQITLEKPLSKSEFQNVFAESVATSPVNPKIYEKCFSYDRMENNYGMDIEKISCSGPYFIEKWIPKESIRYVKSHNDVLGELYKVDVIEETLCNNQIEANQLFHEDKIDHIKIFSKKYFDYSKEKNVYKEDVECIWTMFVNMDSKDNPILNNKDFRTALFYGVDREAITKDVLGGSTPAPYFIPKGVYVDTEREYRETKEAKKIVPENYGHDKKKAKKAFDKAYKDNGNKKVTVTLKYTDSSDDIESISKYLEKSYEELFGKDKFNLELEPLPFITVYENMESENYDLAIGAWRGSAFSPWKDMQVYTSDYPAKLDTLRNKEFDKLQEKATSGDLVCKEKERFDALVRMEEILYEQMPFIPVYQGQQINIYSDEIELKGKKVFPFVGPGVLQSEIKNRI